MLWDKNSDQCRQCLWTYCQWRMERSAGCPSFWGVDRDHKIPDLTYKNSWWIHVWKWKTHENPKHNQDRLQNGMKLGQGYPRNNKEDKIAGWTEENARRQAARRNRGIYKVLTDDKDDFKMVADARLELEKDTAPAVPCVGRGRRSRETAGRCNTPLAPRRNSQIQKIEEHDVRWSDNMWNTWPKKCVCVGSFSPCLGAQARLYLKKQMEIPAGKPAVDTQWEKLRNTFSLQRRDGEIKVWSSPSSEEGWKKQFHFANLMDLCHLKNAEFAKKKKNIQKYKGRVVLRGDKVKDEEGYRIALTEQGASASQMAAAKFFDTLSKLLGMAGEASDAVSEYTSVNMTEAPWLLRSPIEECPERWLIILPWQRPNSVGIRLTILWYFLKGIQMVTH